MLQIEVMCDRAPNIKRGQFVLKLNLKVLSDKDHFFSSENTPHHTQIGVLQQQLQVNNKSSLGISIFLNNFKS